MRPSRQVFAAYFSDREPLCRPLGKGNINDTWLILHGNAKTVLQRLNGAVFPNPVQVVENFHRVTSRMAERIRRESFPFVVPQIYPTLSGELYFIDDEQNCWRAQDFLNHVPVANDGVDCANAFQLGRTLARFHYLVSDIPSSAITEVIPGFHDIDGYLHVFDQVIARGKYAGREEEGLQECLVFVEKNRERAGRLAVARERGELETRIIHGDPKLDNIIFTGNNDAAGLFDLDTVGNGLLHYDLGDCLRSVCNRSGELVSVSEVVFDTEIFRSVLAGYREGSSRGLADAERRHLVDGVFTIAFELGLRFLSDHLQGDIYFKVKTRGDNLKKSRVQFALARSIVEQDRALQRISTML